MQSSEISSPRGQENPYLSTSSQFSRCLWACSQFTVSGVPARGTDNLGSKARSPQKSVFVAIPGAFSHPAARFAVSQSNRPKMAGKSVVSGLCTQVVQCRQNAWIAGQCHTLHGTLVLFPPFGPRMLVISGNGPHLLAAAADASALPGSEAPHQSLSGYRRSASPMSGSTCIALSCVAMSSSSCAMIA